MSQVKVPEGRWSWVEIDRGALRRNLRAYKSLLAPRQKLCCVVKADAYGHGAIECARVLHSAGADMFAVATVREGVELREAGIQAPILILSEPPITAIPQLIEKNIMPTVYTIEFALAYGECAVRAGTVGKYHLAINGINRNSACTMPMFSSSAVISISIVGFNAMAYLRTSQLPKTLPVGIQAPVQAFRRGGPRARGCGLRLRHGALRQHTGDDARSLDALRYGAGWHRALRALSVRFIAFGHQARSR